MERETVRVSLGDRSYDIRIGPGLLANAGGEMASLVGSAKVAIVTERNVAQFHLHALEQSLREAETAFEVLVLEPGETTKSWAALQQTVEWLIAQRIDRGDFVVALGGGVIGDLVGFAAAIIRRGVRFVQIPTTLLAQVDSSVGGKTAINSPLGKNLIGAFHQPSLVLADTGLLATLSQRDYLAGYGEVVKYGLLGDADFFHWLEDNGEAALQGDMPARNYLVKRSCEMKAEIVEEDETERGRRALLNLGHTFGHALEAATGYSDRLLHGEGVSVGCMLAFEASVAMGLCSQEMPGRIAQHYTKLGMRYRLEDIAGDLPDADVLLDLMGQDKKVEAGRLTFILARDIGDAFVSKDADIGAIRTVLEAALASRQR